MVCFKLLYMDNLWLVEDKGKKVDTERLVQNQSTEPLQSSSEKKKKATSGLASDLAVKPWQNYMR